MFISSLDIIHVYFKILPSDYLKIKQMKNLIKVVPTKYLF